MTDFLVNKSYWQLDTRSGCDQTPFFSVINMLVLQIYRKVSSQCSSSLFAFCPWSSARIFAIHLACIEEPFLHRFEWISWLITWSAAYEISKFSKFWSPALCRCGNMFAKIRILCKHCCLVLYESAYLHSNKIFFCPLHSDKKKQGAALSGRVRLSSFSVFNSSRDFQTKAVLVCACLYKNVVSISFECILKPLETVALIVWLSMQCFCNDILYILPCFSVYILG